MSLRVGLGASQADLDVQGEIDFDFFEESDCTNGTHCESQNDSLQSKIETISHSKTWPEINAPLEMNPSCHNLQSDLGSDGSLPNTQSNYNFNKPVITISCDDLTGCVQKTIETIIPTPFSYKDNKCGRFSPSVFKKSRSNMSPQTKKKNFTNDNEPSDDSSISSMSDSESNLSSVSEDSFEQEETDSMTDVSPIPSPYCYTPTPGSGNDTLASSPKDVKDLKKDGVKFSEDVKNKMCSKCQMLDFEELVNAMNRIQVKPCRSCSGKSKSSIITQKAKSRKNMSFTNEDCRKIDNDNLVLMKKIEAQETRHKTHGASIGQIRTSSAVNRQRLQRQIDLENLALLKRLESTKPSKNLSRIHLLRDYNRRSSGLLSRPSSRSSFPSCSSNSSMRHSTQISGRSSAIGINSSSIRHLASLSTHSSVPSLHSN